MIENAQQEEDIGYGYDDTYEPYLQDADILDRPDLFYSGPG